MQERHQLIEAAAKSKLGQIQMNVKTTFADGKAKSDVDNGQGPKSKEDIVHPDAIVVNQNLPLFPWSFLMMRAEMKNQDPQQFPELSTVVNALRGWRFYHHFRTDPHSPIRMPQVGVCTPTMSSDGRDLAATLQSVISISDGYEIHEAIEEAFPGSQLAMSEQRGRLEIGLQVPGLNRPLSANELSDGTLRYLCLVGALLSLRLPPLVVLNEPETSLHPGLLRPLARLIQRAAQRTQVWVITHSEPLADHIEEYSRLPAIKVRRENGETRLSGASPDDAEEEPD